MEDNEKLAKIAIRHLLRIANKYSRIEKQPIAVGESISVTTREAHTIQIIGERDHMCVTEIARHFGITKSGASQIVSKLEKNGFLEKLPAPNSNKELHLSLTKLGWEAFLAHEKCHGDDMNQLMDSLSVYPIQQIATLSVLLENIEGIMDLRLKEK